MTPTVVLLHSPLTTSAVWGEVPRLLRDAGHDVVVPEVDSDDEPPYALRFVASVAQTLRSSIGSGPCVLVGHSGAGPLLPQVGFARHSGGASVAGYVFLDAMLPRVAQAATRLALMHLEDEGFAHQLQGLLAAGGTFPDWTNDTLAADIPEEGARRLVLRSVQPRGLAFFTETLPQPEDWPDAPVAYLQLSGAYDVPAATARHRGWLVRTLDVGHFAALTDPGSVTEALAGVLREL